MLAEPTAESETDLIREAREASQIPLPAGDSSSVALDGGRAKSNEQRGRKERLLARLRHRNWL